MKRHSVFIVALAVAALAASDAWAQRGGGRGFGRGGGGGGEAMLLQQTSVQEELKLSDEQIQQLTAALLQQRESFGDLRDLSAEERRAKFAEMQQSQRQELAKVLSEEQLSRLKQIALQQRGPQAFGDPEVASALGLTEEQKQSVEASQADIREQMRELFANGPDGDREAAREKIATLQKEAAEQLEKLLTPDQQAKYKALLGAPFAGKIERPSFRGGRQRGPAGDRSTDASSPNQFFQLASFKKDDDDGDDKDDDDAKQEDDDDKPRAKNRDKQSEGAKHARRHGEHGKQKGQAHHRDGKSRQARHGHHGHRRHGHGSATMARHRGRPNARAWNHVAAALEDGPRWHRHGHGGMHQPGHGPAFAQRGGDRIIISLCRAKGALKVVVPEARPSGITTVSAAPALGPTTSNAAANSMRMTDIVRGRMSDRILTGATACRSLPHAVGITMPMVRPSLAGAMDLAMAIGPPAMAIGAWTAEKVTIRNLPDTTSGHAATDRLILLITVDRTGRIILPRGIMSVTANTTAKGACLTVATVDLAANTAMVVSTGPPTSNTVGLLVPATTPPRPATVTSVVRSSTDRRTS